MKKQIITLAVAFFAAFAGVRADTSYLLIQGPFGSGSATETFKWEVNYTAGQLTTGFDLLTAALSSQQLQDTNWGSFGYAVDGFTLGGTSVQNNYPTATWIYYTAGATDGSWTYSNSGASSSSQSNGSFDGWVYGVTTVDPMTWAVTYSDPIVGGTNAPATTNFSGSAIINVPEPAGCALLFIGAGGMLALLKRRRA